MDYTLLKDVIRYIEAFQHASDTHTMEDFVIWLNSKLFSGRQQGKHAAHDDLLIAFKLMYLHKELKKHTKSVLAECNVSSIDEYSFLLHLNAQESFRKMEIIALHNLEAPTGIEVIKRLLRNELIAEFADQEDRRAKRIKITARGKKELSIMKPKIDSVFAEFTAPLTLHEKVHLSGIFDKLSGQVNG